MNLNDAGRMVDAAWSQIPIQFPTFQLDEHVAMPNHFHGIIQIMDVGAPLVGAPKPGGRTGTRPAPTLGDAMGAFKW
jgi:REP element-mobilizing transposase RayT